MFIKQVFKQLKSKELLKRLSFKIEVIIYHAFEETRLWVYKHVGSSCRCCGLDIQSPKLNKLWCDSCIKQFDDLHKCIQCGVPLPKIESSDEVLLDEDLIVKCGGCLRHPKLWTNFYYVAEYRRPLSIDIQELKFKKKIGIASDLAWLLVQKVDEFAPIIIPVPLHWSRYLKRTFNQSYVLSHYFAKHLRIMHKKEVLEGTKRFQVINAFKKVTSSRSQRGLNRKQRQNNLSNSFVLKDKYRKRLKAAKHVAIFDDVLTTGSTVEPLCKLLLENGVERIDIYCICRTPEPKKQE